MRLQHTQIKRSSAEFDLSQGPLVFGHELRKRFSETDGNAPTWLPQASRDLLRGQQAMILEANRGMDPGLLAAMLDRNTERMTSDDSPLVHRPTTVAEGIGKGLTAGTFLGSALQLTPTTSNTTRALLGLAGLGVGLGLANLGPRHPLGRSAVEEWETSQDKPDVVQIARPDRGLLNGALRDAVIGGLGGGTVATLSGVKRLVPLAASVGVGAAGLAALNQALAARGDRIYSGRSKQSSAENIEPYDYESERSRALAQMGGGGILAHLALGLGWLGSGISERKIENQRLLNPSRSLEEFDAARLLKRKLIDNSNRNWAIAAGAGAIPGLVMFGSGLHRVIKDDRLQNSKTSSNNYSGLAYKDTFSVRSLGPKGSKQSSAPNLDEYFKSQEDYVNLRKDEHRNNVALSLLGAVPGAALSGLGMHTLMKNLPNLTLAKGALGVAGLLGGGVLASLPSKLMQKSDTRYRQETGIDPGFEAPPMGAPGALAGAGASIGLGSGLAMTMNRPALAAAAAGVAGLTGIFAVSRAMKRDRERADFAAANDQGAYAAGQGLAEGNRFVRSLSPGMMYVSPVAPGERVLGSG